MSDELNQVGFSSVKGWEQGMEVIGRLFTVAQPGAVYSEPITAGDHTIITTSEVSVGMGLGYGAGGETTGAGQESPAGGDFGGGGGGGGFSSARPVSVISVGPSGVRVEPVVDITKVALAFITAVGAMLVALNKMRRAAG